MQFNKGVALPHLHQFYNACVLNTSTDCIWLLLQTERAAGSTPETTAALEHADAQTASISSPRQSAAYRPASAALSLRSYGRPTGSRSSQTAARPATALAISPSRLEQKCSPNKAANASLSARKASAVITRQPGIPSLDLKDIQQENQGKSASKATQMLSPSIPNAGARQALQESPTRYVKGYLLSRIEALAFCCVQGTLRCRSPNKAATSSASITQQTKEPPWREFIRSVQGQPVSLTATVQWLLLSCCLCRADLY